MKKWYLLGPVVFFFIVALGGCQYEKTLPKGKDIHGNDIDFSALKGKWVVINYWASWCKPCFKEIPELNALSEVDPSKVQVFGVNIENLTPQVLKGKIKELNIGFTDLAFDPGPQFGLTSLQGVPTTLVITPSSKALKPLLGPQTQKGLLALMDDQ